MLLKTKNSKSCHPITQDGSFICTVPGCDFNTKYKFSLQRHTNKCHPRVSSRRSNATKSTARKSRGGSTPSSQNFKCNKCSYSTANKFTLIRHFKTHSKDRPFQCHACEYRSQWKHNVTAHEKAQHFNIPRKIIPPEKMNQRDRKVIKTLGTKKGQQKNLQLDTLRLRISPGNSSGPCEGNFPCKECDYVSKNKRLLTSHMEESHSDDEKAFSCTFRGCTYRSKWPQWVRTHERRVHNFTRRQSSQQVKSKVQQKATLACKKVSSLTARVVKVVQKLPTKQRPTKSNSAQILSSKKAITGSRQEKVKCPQCGVQRYRRFLQSHLRVHSAEKPLSCTVKGCNYRTRWGGDLKVHKKRHDKDSLKSPSSVPLLTRSSDRQKKVGMKATVRQKAPEIIKRFKCPDCDFHGSTSWHVNRHRHTHKNIPPIRCPKIRCRFTTRDVRNLAKHQLKSHSNEPVSRSSRQSLQLISNAKGCRFCGCNKKSHANVKKNLKGRRGWKVPTAVDQPEVDKEKDDEEEEKENFKEPLNLEPVVEELVDSTGFACMLCDFVGFSEAAALNHAKSHTQPSFPVRELNEIPIICLD